MNDFNNQVYRMFNFYSRGGVKRLCSKILYRWIKWYYHCDIPYCIDLKGVWLCHTGLGIVINKNAQIGEGTYIQQGGYCGSP